MEIDDFIKAIEEEFDNLNPGDVSPNSVFRDMEGWSSMHALIFVALIDSKYDVLLNGEELKSCVTINDLFDITCLKLNGGAAKA
jgi:acyl carrier protein